MTNENLERVHTTLNYLVPNAAAQERLTAIRNEAAAEEIYEINIIGFMLSYVLDGIRHENW